MADRTVHRCCGKRLQVGGQKKKRKKENQGQETTAQNEDAKTYPM